MTTSQFLDVCALAGFDYIDTFPALISNGMAFTFKSCIELVQQYQSGFNAVKSLEYIPEVGSVEYLKKFCRASCLVKHHLVWTANSAVEPLNLHSAPGDLQSVFGDRFPDEIFFYMTQGLIMPHIVQVVGTHTMMEPIPLCNGISNTMFKKFLSHERLMRMRVETIGCMVACSGLPHSLKAVEFFTWLDPKKKIDLPNKDMSVLLKSWATPKSIRPANEKSGPLDMLNVMSILGRFNGQGMVSNAKVSAETFGSPNSRPVGDTQVMFTTFGQFLTCRNYVSSDKHMLTVLGTAFQKVLSTPSLSYPEKTQFVPSWMTLMEMILTGVSFIEYPSSYADAKPLHGLESREIMYFARVVSVLSLNSTGVPWTGPLSRDLLEFNSFAKISSRAMRGLLESLLLANTVSCVQPPFEILAKKGSSKSHLIEVAGQLPFGTDLNTTAGIIAKHFLTATMSSAVAKDKSSAKHAKIFKDMDDNLSISSSVANWDYDTLWVKTIWKFWEGWGMILQHIVADEQLKNSDLTESEWSCLKTVTNFHKSANNKIRAAHGLA